MRPIPHNLPPYLLLFHPPTCRNGIVRSTSDFVNYNFPEGFPLPERAEDPLADAYIENTQRYFKSMEEKEEEERSECTTPKAPSSQSVSNHWSDVTLNESFSRSGRYSRYSWESAESADENVSDLALPQPPPSLSLSLPYNVDVEHKFY